MDKYQTLYVLAKEVMSEEIRRFDLVTQKAMNYLTVLSVILGLAVYPGRWLCRTILPPGDFLAWALLVAAVLLGVTLLLAWVSCFSVMRGQRLHKLPMNEEMIAFFDQHEQADIHYALARRISEGHLANMKETNKRTRLLAQAHDAIWAGAVLFVVVAALGLVYLWTRPGCSVLGRTGR